MKDGKSEKLPKGKIMNKQKITYTYIRWNNQNNTAKTALVKFTEK